MKKRHAALILATSTVVPYLMVAFERWSLHPLVWGGKRPIGLCGHDGFRVDYCDRSDIINNKFRRMKNLKIQVPEGYEIDKEKSTFENIILKKIEKKRPLSVKEIEGREWFITGGGLIDKADYRLEDLNNVSTKERAEAFLALMQLVELRDAWNDSVDQEWDSDGAAYVLVHYSSGIKRDEFARYTPVLRFKTVELRNRFHEQFRGLIETAKELI